MHFASVLMIYGASLFFLYGGKAAQQLLIRRKLTVWLIASVCVANLSALAWWDATAVTMSGNWASASDTRVLRAVLTGTAYGHLWFWRLALGLMLLGALLVWRSILASKTGCILIAMGGAMLAGSLAGTGHAIMLLGPRGVLLVGVQVLHLLAAGMWLGGLPPLILALFNVRTHFASLQLDNLVLLLRRFSAIGIFAVALIGITGLISAALILSDARALLSTYYGVVLSGKILAFLLMTVLAIDNRWRWTARITNSMPRLRSRNAISSLAANVGVEIGLGFLVLALVALLGTLPPESPQHSADVELTCNC